MHLFFLPLSFAANVRTELHTLFSCADRLLIACMSSLVLYMYAFSLFSFPLFTCDVCVCLCESVLDFFPSSSSSMSSWRQIHFFVGGIKIREEAKSHQMTNGCDHGEPDSPHSENFRHCSSSSFAFFFTRLSLVRVVERKIMYQLTYTVTFSTDVPSIRSQQTADNVSEWDEAIHVIIILSSLIAPKKASTTKAYLYFLSLMI